MDDLAALYARVRARAEEESEELPPRLTEAEVARAEAALGFALPPVLSGLYLRVANGGFGPDYQLFPLVGEGRTAVSEYGSPGAVPAGAWPRGVLPVLDWGCGMYAAVDCLRPDAPVLLFEPNAYSGDWSHAWFEDAPSLARWLDSWLDDSGWWEEEVMDADEGDGLAPWPDAAIRLAATP